MQAQDMSIFWNSNKGQYETNNYNYYKNDNTFTRTADQRIKYKEETSYTEEIDEEENEAIVQMESWIGTFFLLLIQGVNVIALIKMAISCKSASKKTFARALLLMGLILITLALIFMALTCNKIDYTGLLERTMSFGKSVFVKVKGLI